MDWDDSTDYHCWNELSRETMLTTPIFKLIRSKRADNEHRTGDFFVLDAPEWVTVIPLVETDGDGGRSFLMVRQYRHGSEQLCVEFPAGVVDKDETAIEAARRELLEETGHTATQLIEIGSVNPNPAFMTNRTHTFIALGLKKESDQSLDPLEKVEYGLVSELEVLDRMGTEEFGNGIMLISLVFYQKWLRETGTEEPSSL